MLKLGCVQRNHVIHLRQIAGDIVDAISNHRLTKNPARFSHFLKNPFAVAGDYGRAANERIQ